MGPQSHNVPRKLELISELKRPYRWLRDRRAGPLSTFHRRRYSQELGQVLARHSSPPALVLFTPSVEWGLTLFQRPQQLAVALADLGCLVFYSEPSVMQTYPDGFHKVRERLFVCNTPIDIFNAVPGLWVYTLVYNARYLDKLPDKRVIYDHIDELSVFPYSLSRLQRDHARLINRADRVVATATRLYEDVSSHRPDALLCPNGVDYTFFKDHTAAAVQPPEDIAGLVASGRPLIGYYGALAHWFDYDLLCSAARLRPEYWFLLIGPDHDHTVQSSGISSLENILWLGPRPYQEIPAYLKFFSVATIPFLLNEITHATSPLKLFEYFAGGKPVVTTAMRECLKYPPVQIAGDAASFVEQLDEALVLKDDPVYLAQLEQLALANTWQERAASILGSFSE